MKITIFDKLLDKANFLLFEMIQILIYLLLPPLLETSLFLITITIGVDPADNLVAELIISIRVSKKTY